MSHSIQPIPAVEEYFGPGTVPVIVQEFRPGGWVTTGYRKRVSRSWLRKLKGEGVIKVGLEFPGQPHRIADFSIEELLRS